MNPFKPEIHLHLNVHPSAQPHVPGKLEFTEGIHEVTTNRAKDSNIAL